MAGILIKAVPDVDFQPCGGEDLIEAADALGDLRVVIDGSNLEWGFPGEKILREIHRSNMSKLGADGQPIRREDGKILKGPSYEPPQIRQILDLYASVPTLRDEVRS